MEFINYTSRISHTSSVACEAGGFSLARGHHMSSELKKQSVFKSEASHSLVQSLVTLLPKLMLIVFFAKWSRIFAFVCI